MRVRFRPLVWVGARTPKGLRSSKYECKSPWPDTVDLLGHELAHLGAEDFVIEADFDESEICPDGMPRADARPPSFPGIRIVFESKYGPLAFQTDTCVFWHHNVCSIALALEGLRAVDSYGITPTGEQYAGFSAIGSGPAKPASGEPYFADASSAVRWLCDPDVCGSRGAEDAALKSVLRLVARHTHPDHGGSREQWDKYQEAHRLLSEAGMV